MHGYVDVQHEVEKAFEERQYRRRRAIAGIRGSLRLNSNPRLLTAACLLISALPGAVVGYLFYRLGLSPWGPTLAVAVLATWPIFVYTSWWAANRLFETKDLLKDLKTNVMIDALHEDKEAPFAAERASWRDTTDWKHWTGTEDCWPVAIGHIPFLIILAFLSLGTWCVWKLIAYGPTLLTEIIVDGCLIRQFPKIENTLALEDWKHNTFIATGVYFIMLAVVVGSLGGLYFAWFLYTPSHN